MRDALSPIHENGVSCGHACVPKRLADMAFQDGGTSACRHESRTRLGAEIPDGAKAPQIGHFGVQARPRCVRKERWITFCFIVASGLILFFHLWGRTLENHDYLRYAEVTREMIRSGDWIVPRYNGEIYIDKPPLLFWLMAIPSSFYGSVTPLLARLPSALAAWIGVMILFLWGRRTYGTIESGLLSGSVLLTTYQYFFEARIAKTDMLLCIMVLLSLYLFYNAYEERERSFLQYGLSFFFMGLGVLTKGPFGIVVPMFVVIAFLLKERTIRILGSRAFLLGYVVLGATVLPWAVLFIKSVGWVQTLDLIRANHILTRTAPFYFYFVEIWPQFFPWSLLLPFLFVFLWRRRNGPILGGESFAFIWFVLVFILLTLFTYRASRYLLPALPPLALMIGGMWRKKLIRLLVPCCLAVLMWHGVEGYWRAKNFYHSPGKALAGELRPLLEGSVLSGFRLDVSTVEEINFYLDRVIPIVKKAEHLAGNKFVLMPEDVYRRLLVRGYDSILLIRQFEYKGERLFLVSS